MRAPGPETRRRRTVANHHPLVAAFEAILIARGKTLGSISKDVGLTDQTMHTWFAGRTPRVAHLDYALNALGFRLVIAPLAEDPTAVILAREVRRP